MNNKKKEIVKDIDLNELERVKGADLFSIESLVLTVRSAGILDNDQIPEWMLNYPVPDGTIKCPDDPYKCFTKLLKIQRQTGINVHPANQIDTLLIDASVTVSTTGIAYKVDDETKTIGTVCGYLLSDPNDVEKLCHASSADLLVTDAKYSKDGKIIMVDWPKNFGVPVSNAVKYRPYSGSLTPGRAKPREEIFSYLCRENNSLVGIRMHTLIGANLKNFTEIEGLEEQLRAVYLARKAKVPDDFSVKVIGIQGGTLPWTDEIENAYRMYFKSISIRGGRDGKNVAHGFERFSMSRMNANILNLVVDMKRMLERYHADTILIKTQAFTNEEMRVMVANGISIVAANSPFPDQVKVGVPGIYGKYLKTAKVIEYFKIDEDWVKPDLVAKKEKDSPIKFGPYYDNAVTLVANRVRCFAYIYLDTRLKSFESKISILPSCTADTLKVIIASGLDETFSISDLVQRGTQAISCRNRFVHLRKPFFSVDPLGEAVKWNTPVVLPRLKCKDQKKIIDCTLFTEEAKIEIIPVSVDLSMLKNRVTQMTSKKLVGLEAVRAALDLNQDFLFMVMMGISQDDPNLYVREINEDWRKRFSSILDMEEEMIISMLASIDERVVGAYEQYKKSNYVEVIPFDDDVIQPIREVSAAPIPAPVVATTGPLGLRVDMSKRRKPVKKSDKGKKKKKVSSPEEDGSSSQDDEEQS